MCTHQRELMAADARSSGTVLWGNRRVQWTIRSETHANLWKHSHGIGRRRGIHLRTTERHIAREFDRLPNDKRSRRRVDHWLLCTTNESISVTAPCFSKFHKSHSHISVISPMIFIFTGLITRVRPCGCVRYRRTISVLGHFGTRQCVILSSDESY